MKTDSQALLEEIQQRLLSNRSVESWPEMAGLVQRSVAPDASPCWEYPVFAAIAAGGDAADAAPATAAIFCLLQSIHLVDDILDDDPDGQFHRFGVGHTANLGLAFQALAAQVLEDSSIPPSIAAKAHSCVARIALSTAVGQRLDTLEISSEDDYWRATLAKTPPLFSGALMLGALMAKGTEETCASIASLGEPIGKIVQLNDDLRDATQIPASADWQGAGNNLAILYAKTADHPERQRLLDLIPQVEESPAALTEAQAILVRSGAVSYCSLHMIETYRSAYSALQTAEIPDRKPLADLLDHLVRPLESLLAAVGVESPAGLFRP